MLQCAVQSYLLSCVRSVGRERRGEERLKYKCKDGVRCVLQRYSCPDHQDDGEDHDDSISLRGGTSGRHESSSPPTCW